MTQQISWNLISSFSLFLVRFESSEIDFIKSFDDNLLSSMGFCDLKKDQS